MTVKNKTKKFISLLLVISVLAPAVLFLRPKQIGAAWWSSWVTDVNTTVISGTTATGAGAEVTQTAISLKKVAQEITRQIFMTVARRFLQEMTKNTINWINSGFHGNPLYLENPSSFFRDIAKYEIKTFIDLTGYDYLRFPFGKDFALNTIGAYRRQTAENLRYTLSNVFTDPVLFSNFRSNFEVGGWNGFLINTQYPQNNYLGFQMLATEELLRRLDGTATNAANRVMQTLDQGMGFLSPKTCPSNPQYNNGVNEFRRPSFNISKFNSDYYQSHPSPISQTSEEVIQWERDYQNALAIAQMAWSATNYCPGGLVDTTPGSVVASQITNAMGSQFRQSELAAAMGNSISAILDALMNKFIGSGLNALTTRVNQRAPEVDNWDFYGNTLGTAVPRGNNAAWNAGPDQPIILSDFRRMVKDGIDNTNKELRLMNNESPTNPGIIQLLGQIWPKVRELDRCQPGPDLSWKERADGELSRNSKKLQEKLNDNDGDKSAEADSVLKELRFAVNFFKDWINNKMMTELPNSVLYMDAVEEIETLSQEADELTSKRRTKAQVLARLQSIRTALATFTAEPEAGTGGERTLILLKKQYDATSHAVSNTASIEDARNELDVAKDKLANLNRLVAQCGAERIARGWSVPGKWNSVFSGGGGSGGDLVWAWRDWIGGPPYTPQACAPGVAGCVNGLLRDPKAYFLALIGRSEGARAQDWETVLTNSGIPQGPPPGVRSNPSIHYGITQQIGAGGVRGRLFLPTDSPDGLNYYTYPIDVLASSGGGGRTERALFCNSPIKGGYSHETFINTSGVTHPEIPLVNANDVLKWRGKLGLFGHSANIEMSCKIIYGANVLDYKGNLPGVTNIVEPHEELPDDTGTEDGGGDGGECTRPSDPGRHPNMSAQVTQAREQLIFRDEIFGGVDCRDFEADSQEYDDCVNTIINSPDYECDRFRITNLAAKLIGSGAGLWNKPSGNNCQGYSVDIVAFPDGYIYDVVGGGGDGTEAMWNMVTCMPLEPNKWRPTI